jgi:hypothetical protein
VQVFHANYRLKSSITDDTGRSVIAHAAMIRELIHDPDIPPCETRDRVIKCIKIQQLFIGLPTLSLAGVPVLPSASRDEQPALIREKSAATFKIEVCKATKSHQVFRQLARSGLGAEELPPAILRAPLHPSRWILPAGCVETN